MVACRQSTWPVTIGPSPDRKAKVADTEAIVTATQMTQTMPSRLTTAKQATIAAASGATGTPGRYHCWMADAERMAVRPQVGTHPHQ